MAGPWILTLLLCLAAYLAASVNFAILLFLALGRGDPRQSHSGNAGATNVKRQLGLAWAALVLLLDMGRAGLVAWAAVSWLPLELWPTPGLFLILGNRYPLFHGFRGGKGVANYLGFSLVLQPTAAGLACLAWLIAYAMARRPFIGSFFMVTVLGLGNLSRCLWQAPAMAAVLGTLALIFLAHGSNLAALRREMRGELSPSWKNLKK
jgi:glycerol-3-phosphate acyltransferase PlsY